MNIFRFLAFLTLIAASCEVYRYDLSQNNNSDYNNQNSHHLIIKTSDYVVNYFDNADSCYLDTRGTGKYEFPLKCQLNSPPMKIDLTNCISLYRANLSDPTNTPLPDTTSGKWKIRISGSYMVRNFFNLQVNEKYAYWIDSMEIYIFQGVNRYYLGTIQGDKTTQQDPFKSSSLLFESQIPPNTKADAIDLRFIRRCESKNFDFNNSGAIPKSITDPQLSNFEISGIEFIQIQ